MHPRDDSRTAGRRRGRRQGPELLQQDQLLLPGQAAAPPGPADLSGMYTAHFAFRRDLESFVAAARATPAHDRDTWTALHRRWQRTSGHLHVHHTQEDDRLWPLVLSRLDPADDAARQVLHALEDEHDHLHTLLDNCGTGLARMCTSGEEDDRLTLAADLRATQHALDTHLAHEEREGMSVVQGHLSRADWADFERAALRDGFRLRDVPFTVCWSLHRLPAEGRRRLLARAPGLGLVWRLLRPSFERAEQRAFRWGATDSPLAT